MEENKFEKSQKKIIGIFNIIYGFAVANLFAEIFIKILDWTNLLKYDLSEYGLLQWIVSFIYTAAMFWCVKLAKKAKKSAGFMGIIMGLLEILAGSTVWKCIGAGLLINSITYLINFKENKGEM